MKRYLAILVLALLPIGCFAGIDDHNFTLAPKVTIPTGLHEIAAFGVEGIYEMNLNRVILGAGLGLNSEFHHDFLFCNITAPVFLRAGYKITDRFMASVNGGYKFYLIGWCLGVGGVADNPRINGLFIEPQLSYNITPGIRLSLGTELYKGCFQKSITEISDGSIREYAKDITGIYAGITLGVSFTIGRSK